MITLCWKFKKFCIKVNGCNRLGAYGSYTNKINSTIKTCPLLNNTHSITKHFVFLICFSLSFCKKLCEYKARQLFMDHLRSTHFTIHSSVFTMIFYGIYMGLAELYKNVQYYRTILSKQVFVGYKLQLNNNYAFQMTPEFTVSTRDCVRGSGRGWRNNNNKE